MFNKFKSQKGVVLYVVLGTMMVVILLANIVMNIIANQNRLTHHQVSRIQAYYAALAGINYAWEKINLANDPIWPVNNLTAYTRTICESGCDVEEDWFPGSVRRVTVTIGADSDTIPREISAVADYQPQE